MPIETVRTQEGPLCIVRAHGASTLVEAVEFIRRNIDLCRTERIGMLLINVAGVTAVPMPTLVDRFLAAEDWAHASDGRVAVALVTDSAYIHPQKFGVKAATHFGLSMEIYPHEADALAWLAERSTE